MPDDETIRRAYAFGYRSGHLDTLAGDVDYDLVAYWLTAPTPKE